MKFRTSSMKFAYIVTGLVFLLSHWISDNVTVLHKCGHANRYWDYMHSFRGLNFLLLKEKFYYSTVTGKFGLSELSIFLPTWKTFADKLWNDSSIDLCLNFLYLFWAYQLAVLDSFTFYSMRNGSMNSYPIFTNLKKNKK